MGRRAGWTFKCGLDGHRDSDWAPEDEPENENEREASRNPIGPWENYSWESNRYKYADDDNSDSDARSDIHFRVAPTKLSVIKLCRMIIERSLLISNGPAVGRVEVSVVRGDFTWSYRGRLV